MGSTGVHGSLTRSASHRRSPPGVQHVGPQAVTETPAPCAHTGSGITVPNGSRCFHINDSSFINLILSVIGFDFLFGFTIALRDTGSCLTIVLSWGNSIALFPQAPSGLGGNSCLAATESPCFVQRGEGKMLAEEICLS